MNKLFSFLKTELGRLVALAISLVALMWLLNFLAARGLGPLSTGASWTRNTIQGNAGVPIVAPATLSPVANTVTYRTGGM